MRRSKQPAAKAQSVSPVASARPRKRFAPWRLGAALLTIGLSAGLSSGLAAKPKAKKTAKAAKATPKPLSERSTADILANYTFVGDFEQKDAERPVSDEVFWRYPFELPKVEFPIKETIDNPKVELPATRGDGRAVDHLNRGRIAFLNGDFLEAKGTWLSARARFGNRYPFHRRDDYFIAYSMMNLGAKQMREKALDWDQVEIKSSFANAATFLSWAFIVKADQPDPLLDIVTPKGLYNLAAIYWRYGRFAGAFGAADTGLNFLRKTGRKEFRPEFHRFVAEAHIRNRSYLEAVQELDTAIRQDINPQQASAAFARAGDIYFDLNNYDLAEDAYSLGAKVDEDMRQINPAQLVLRGESLFWLGKFSEAQKILHFALEGGAYRSVVQPLPDAYASWASLRIADAFLARKDLDKARLEYYKVGHEYPSTLPGRLAKVRSACLELPYYKGHNVEHARELLEEAKQGSEMPALAQELAWACQVGSYTDRERTPEMLERVKQFAAAYPDSGFLKSFVGPVRAFQASKIEDYFKSGDVYRALSFFEKNRKNLFPKVDPSLQRRLFVSYADIHKSEAAAEFWPAYAKEPDSDMKALRQAVVAAEIVSRHVKGVWADRDRGFQKELPKRSWRIAPDKLAVNYLDRMQTVATMPGHLPWMYNLARHFGEQEPSYICDLEYPMLSRLNARGNAYTALVEKRTDELIKAQLPELFRHDESCALSLLELEANRLKTAPKLLAAQYLKRKDWPLVAGFLHLYWTISEHVYDSGETAEARQLWEVIRDKGTVGSPEVEFAKARLDPTRTEFEKLWD